MRMWTYKEKLTLVLFLNTLPHIAISEQKENASTYVLERVNALGGLLNLAADNLGDQLGGELLESAGSSLSLDDLHHLLSDGANLR